MALCWRSGWAADAQTVLQTVSCTLEKLKVSLEHNVGFSVTRLTERHESCHRTQMSLEGEENCSTTRATWQPRLSHSESSGGISRAGGELLSLADDDVNVT